MSNNDPKSLSDILSSEESALGRLAREARTRLDLSDYIRAGLPPDLSIQMTGCNLDANGILIVRTNSPEWAARFRFESRKILDLCRDRHPETQSIKVRVAHPGPSVGS
jgi:hypothetical protein